MMRTFLKPLICAAAILAALGVARSQTSTSSPTSAPASRPTSTPTSGPVLKTASNDNFNRILIAQMNPLWTRGYNDFVEPKVEWKNVAAEIAKTNDPAERQRREQLVAFWRAVVKVHDVGMANERPAVFEAKMRAVLQGDKFPWMGASLNFDIVPYRQYLLDETLPDWAASLRYVAAGLAAGEGRKEGMDILADAAAVEFARKYEPRTLDEWAFYESQMGARTEKALPLWQELLVAKDRNLRYWATRNIAGISSPATIPLLLSVVDMPAPAVRAPIDYLISKKAALALMDRDEHRAAKTLLAVIDYEMAKGPRTTVDIANIFVKLDQWQEPNVPWNMLEYNINDRVRTNSQIYVPAIQLAGFCLQAGRTKVALPFLLNSIVTERGGNVGPDNKYAWMAANTLLSAGRPEPLPIVGRYFEAGGTEWHVTADALGALGDFLASGKATEKERQAVFYMAAKTFERRQKLLGDWCAQGFVALGNMGGVVRVQVKDGKLELYDVVPLSYTEKYGLNPMFIMDSVLKAKVNSLVASAKQDKITLPPGFVDQYKQSQLAILNRLAAGNGAAKPTDAEAEIQAMAREALLALEASDWND